MSTPTNNDASASPVKFTHAKEAIKKTEELLANALRILEQAQRIVMCLQTDLAERRTALCPEQRLNMDILALIFESCAQENPLTLLTIARVSRRWRTTVLSMPKAWSHLPLEASIHPRALQLFVDRSHPLPIHVVHPYVPAEVLLELDGIADRLHCASLSKCVSHSLPARFPQLERLFIGDKSFVYREDLNSSRFPRLRHFVYDSELMPSVFACGSPSQLPPLETLSVHITVRPEWHLLLDGCKDTLVSLRIHATMRISLTERKYQLPHLKTLEIYNTNEGTWPLKLETPVLETYIVQSDSNSSLHTDLGTLKHLRTNSTPQLHNYPMLQVLQLEGEADVFDVISQLGTYGICLDLERIEQRCSARTIDPDEVTSRLEAITSRPVRYSAVNEFSYLGVLLDSEIGQ